MPLLQNSLIKNLMKGSVKPLRPSGYYMLYVLFCLNPAAVCRQREAQIVRAPRKSRGLHPYSGQTGMFLKKHSSL